MSSFDFQLLLMSAVTLLYLPYRVFRIFHIKDSDQRIFYTFWIWPLLFFILYNQVPMWDARPWLFQLCRIFLVAGLALDFFYYFGLKTKTAVKHQVAAGLLLIPVLLFTFRHHLERDTVQVVSPYLARCLVWTDSVFSPRTWYFMDPKTHGGLDINANYDDPTYGKAVFSPINGTFSGMQGEMLVIYNDEVRLHLGPVIEGSHRLQPGQQVIENQPMGLVGRDNHRVPGLRLTVIGDAKLRFRDVYSGRLLGRRFEQTAVTRNQLLLNDSETRFRVNPVNQ